MKVLISLVLYSDFHKTNMSFASKEILDFGVSFTFMFSKALNNSFYLE